MLKCGIFWTVAVFTLSPSIKLIEGETYDDDYEFKTQDQLVDHLKSIGDITSKEVENAMRNTDRKNYVDSDWYAKFVPEIGFASLIASPHHTAIPLELLKDHLINASRALDIGSGSGYVTACMALLLGRPGYVVAIEHIPQIVTKAKRNIKADNPQLIKKDIVKFIVGDGRKGVPQDAPYDAIHVGGILPEIPQELIDQLKNGGRMVIPVGVRTVRYHNLTVVDKDLNGKVTQFIASNTVYYRPISTWEDQCPSTEKYDPIADLMEDDARR